MKPIANAILIGALTLSITGCVYIGDGVESGSWKHEQRKNREIINQLTLDTDQASVQNKLGTPDFSEAFKINDETYKILFYRTQRTHSDGDTSKDETTPLVFKDGRLIGWGKSVLESLER